MQLKNMLVKMGIFSNFRGENKKYSKPPTSNVSHKSLEVSHWLSQISSNPQLAKPLKYHFLDYGWNYSTCQVAWNQQPITKVNFKNCGKRELRSYGTKKKQGGDLCHLFWAHEYMMFAFLWDSQGKRAKKGTVLWVQLPDSNTVDRAMRIVLWRGVNTPNILSKKLAIIIVWNREFQLQLFDLGRIERCIQNGKSKSIFWVGPV